MSNSVVFFCLGVAVTAFGNLMFSDSTFVDDLTNKVQSYTDGTKTMKIVMPTDTYDGVRYNGQDIQTIFPYVAGTVEDLRQADRADNAAPAVKPQPTPQPAPKPARP